MKQRKTPGDQRNFIQYNLKPAKPSGLMKKKWGIFKLQKTLLNLRNKCMCMYVQQEKTEFEEKNVKKVKNI